MTKNQSKAKKWLIRIGKVLGVFTLLYLILCLIGPGSYRVERSKEMSASPEAIYSQVSDFELWQNWSPWKEKDSTLKSEYSGEPGTIGHSTSWEGDPDLSGKGSMEIIDFKENEFVTYKLKFENPSMESTGSIELVQTENGTAVKWFDEGNIPFIMRSMMLFMDMDGMMGPDFERGLVKLDSMATLKQNEMSAQYSFKEVDYPGGNFYGVRRKMNISEVDSTLYGQTYGQLGMFCGENGIEMTGMPVSLGFEWNEEAGTCDIMPAFPVADITVQGTEGISSYNIPAGKALVLDYYGPYEEIYKAYEQLDLYCQKNGLTSSVVFEEYVDDPSTKESMDEVLTKVYFILD